MRDHLTIPPYLPFVKKEEINDHCKKNSSVLHLMVQRLNYSTGEDIHFDTYPEFEIISEK